MSRNVPIYKTSKQVTTQAVSLTKAHHSISHRLYDVKPVSIDLNILIFLSGFRGVRLRSIFHVCISTSQITSLDKQPPSSRLDLSLNSFIMPLSLENMSPWISYSLLIISSPVHISQCYVFFASCDKLSHCIITSSTGQLVVPSLDMVQALDILYTVYRLLELWYKWGFNVLLVQWNKINYHSSSQQSFVSATSVHVRSYHATVTVISDLSSSKQAEHVPLSTKQTRLKADLSI